MSVITVNPELATMLSNIKDVTELQDLQGNVLGSLQTSEKGRRRTVRTTATYARSSRNSGKRETGGVPFEELMRHLESLEPSE